MMRFLMIACGGLLLANVAVLMWPDQVRTAPHIYPPKSDVNPNFVRLNKEIEDKYYATASSATASSAAAGTGSQVAEKEPGECYRLGPFMHLANYEVAQAVLFNADVDFRGSTRASMESNVYRVYLGLYASPAVAADARTELKRKGLLDHFVRQETDGQYIVSLGIYTTEESANKAIEPLSKKLESVKLRQEMMVLPSSYWLHIDIDDQGQIGRQLARMDWGEQSTRLGRYPCQAE